MKKVLIVTYYWPPAGGSGVQRVLKFAKYLPQFGWQPIILTVENPDCPVIDETLKNDIPPECKVYKTKSIEPFSLYKRFTGQNSSSKIPGDILYNFKYTSLKERFAKWVRLNLFLPDAKIGWKYHAVKEGKKIIEKEKVDLIFSSSPPHTIQLVAKRLADLSNLKWVADFRDPWLELIHYQANQRSKFSIKIESALEKKVLRTADKIITVSDSIKNMFESKLTNISVSIITNGYDESDLEYHPVKKDENFIITYAGMISDTKIPNELFSAVSKLKQEGNKNFKLIFAGKVSDKFTEVIKSYNLLENYEFKGYLPHSESVKLLLESNVLLLLIDNIPNNRGIITGKIFEYLGSKIPIFAIGPVNGDAHKILKETNAGEMINYNDNSGAYLLLKKMYNEWKHNNLNYSFEVEKYSRKKLTEALANIFNEQIK